MSDVTQDYVLFLMMINMKVADNNCVTRWSSMYSFIFEVPVHVLVCDILIYGSPCFKTANSRSQDIQENEINYHRKYRFDFAIIIILVCLFSISVINFYVLFFSLGWHTSWYLKMMKKRGKSSMQMFKNLTAMRYMTLETLLPNAAEKTANRQWRKRKNVLKEIVNGKWLLLIGKYCDTRT